MRAASGIEAAIARPQATFGGDDLYPDPAAKAAALMHALIANHPFVDGNKRAAAMSAELFLLFNGYELLTSEQDFEVVTMAAARGELEAEELAIWFRQRMEPIQR